MTEYTPPVSGLLKLGEPAHLGRAIDYAALGFGPAHIPELIRLLNDNELAFGDSDTPEVFAQVHAWRVLGQLRASEAVEPLLDLLAKQEGDEWNDWAMDEVPGVLAQIGPSIIPLVVARLEQRGQQESAPSFYADTLQEVAHRFPDVRAEVVAQLCRVLETATANNAALNGLIVVDLIDLEADDAWPVIEAAFATGNVDETIAGDAPDVKWQLGLGPKPPPRRYDTLGVAKQGWKPPVQGGSNAKQRFNERQKKKKVEKKNKKKRK